MLESPGVPADNIIAAPIANKTYPNLHAPPRPVEYQSLAAHRVDLAERAVRSEMASGTGKWYDGVRNMARSVMQRAIDTGHPAAFIAVMRAAGLLRERNMQSVVTLPAADLGALGEIVELYRQMKAQQPAIVQRTLDAPTSPLPDDATD